MKFKQRPSSREPFDREEPKRASGLAPRIVSVTLDLGASGRRTVEVPVTTAHPTVDTLIQGAIQVMRQADFDDHLFANEAEKRYTKSTTSVAHRMGQEFYPVSRNREIELIDTEFHFSLAQDHTGGSSLPPLTELIGELARKGPFLWLDNTFYAPIAEHFMPVAELPPLRSEPRYRLVVLWFIAELVEVLDRFLQGTALPLEAVTCPYEGLGRLDPVDITSKQSLLFLGGEVYELVPSLRGSIQTADQRRFEKGNHIDAIKSWLAGLEQRLTRLHEEERRKCERIIEALRQRLQERCEAHPPEKTNPPDAIYENQGWRLRYDEETPTIVVEKDGTPFIMEDSDGAFYCFDCHYTLGFCLSAQTVDHLIRGKGSLPTPRVLRPSRFIHPFVSSEQAICTGSLFEDYVRDNPFRTLIGGLLETEHVLRAGYYGYSSGERRPFTPFHSLSACVEGNPHLRVLPSLEAAHATGYPLYRYYLEDRQASSE